MFAAEYPAVVRTVYLVLYDYARSQKIAQDAFVQLLRHWEKVRRYEAPEAWVRRVASEIGFDAAYGRSPYLKVCDSWPVGEATAEVGELVRSDVPVLAIIGALGPYVRPDQAREGLGEFSNLSIVVAPADGHNVVAKTDCMLNTRNAWVDNPAMDPAGKASSAGARVAWDLRESIRSGQCGNKGDQRRQTLAKRAPDALATVAAKPQPIGAEEHDPTQNHDQAYIDHERSADRFVAAHPRDHADDHAAPKKQVVEADTESPHTHGWNVRKAENALMHAGTLDQ